MSQYFVESDCCSHYTHPSFLCLCNLLYKVLLLANIIQFSIKTFVYLSAHLFRLLLHYKYKQLLCFTHKVKYLKQNYEHWQEISRSSIHWYYSWIFNHLASILIDGIIVHKLILISPGFDIKENHWSLLLLKMMANEHFINIDPSISVQSHGVAKRRNTVIKRQWWLLEFSCFSDRFQEATMLAITGLSS